MVPLMARNTATEPPILLRPSETAALIGFSIAWLNQRIADGEVPVVRIGASVRIRRADVEAFARTGKWPAQDGKAKT